MEGLEFLEQFVPSGVIVVLCLLIGQALKWAFTFSPNAERLTAGIPWMLGVAGAVLGLIAMAIVPEFAASDALTALAIGAVSGLASCGAFQVGKQIEKLGR